MRISDWSSDVCSSDLAAILEAAAGRGHHRVLHRARQKMQCPAPGIALVVDVALHDGEHRARAVGLDLRDFAEQRRNVGVTGVGQITAHLGFRMTTTRQLADDLRSEEHTSELQSLMRISYAVFCLKKKKNIYK